MTILQSDIALFQSVKMDDTPNGGGAPSAKRIPFGGSNGIFRDISSIDRAGGRAQVRVIYLGVGSDNADPALGVHIFVSKPSSDPNVSVVLVKCPTFATRAEVAAAIEGYLVRSVEIGPYLLEDHVKGSNIINLFHRPGTTPPGINDTLFLTINEGQAMERVEPVRVTRVTTEEITATVMENNVFRDFPALRSRCELADRLKNAWVGSPPSRMFARETAKTRVRSSTVADSAQFFGASYLTQPAAMGSRTVRAESIFGQIVPNTRSGRPSIDQRPAASSTIVLASSPRRVEVNTAGHTGRILVTAANQSSSWVWQMRPLPAKGTIKVSMRAQNNWYELRDNGDGTMSGDGVGVGQYDPMTGSLALSFEALPDVGSYILIEHADNVGFTNRSGGNIQLAPPEYCFMLPDDGLIAESLTFQWESNQQLCTATVSATGEIAGDAAGLVDAPSGTVLIRPKKMPDPRGEVLCSYQVDKVITELLTPTAPDAAGFVRVTTTQQPAARSLQLSWATARTVSSTSGANQTTTNAIKNADVTYSIRSVPESYTPVENTGGSSSGGGSGGIAPVTYPRFTGPTAIHTD